MKFLKFTIAFLVLTSSLIFIISSEKFYIDLIQSFTFHAMLGYIFLSALFALFRWKYVTFAAFSASLLLAVYLLPHISGESNPAYSVSGETLKVAHFNVLGSNRHFDDIINNSIDLNADILSFQEVERAWALKLMDGLEMQYPYFAITEHEKHGVAIFSKYPLKNLKTYKWTGEPTLTGDVVYQDKNVHFITTHTLSPRNPERYKNRNEHLSKIAEYVKNINGPVLAIGDFNAVPWNKYIVKIKESTDLVDSRKSIASTYPANYPLGLPIDYILHSDELSCVNFKAVNAMGSDHKGIVGEYVFNTPTMLVDMN
ncbi:endonuclease/exonuclease/phosphatase (EEP) superfamily protein YafD [Catalinimonas alkaloidigena]|uniref:endonuclease/exonuclease/phosphatase family protein n=1 Tax=Catalinimonas alkaloidigena TaxID=1075417 RepID=UPI0024050E6E|nr:endonuclease/exonuclease/phosphatase family protein [Catalinimonas alkaloidigena]MDF9797107.1 endonuclease/exonuclease/phosphatase (EEP) superfamily protein YafD [Catalinimonas alkaloidigena]